MRLRREELASQQALATAARAKAMAAQAEAAAAEAEAAAAHGEAVSLRIACQRTERNIAAVRETTSELAELRSLVDRDAAALGSRAEAV